MKVIRNETGEKLDLICNQKPKRSEISSGFFFVKESMSTIITENGNDLPVTILRYVQTTVLSSEHGNKATVFVEYGGKINKPIAGVLSKCNQLKDSRFKFDGVENAAPGHSKQIGKIKSVDLYKSDIESINFDEFKIGDVLDISGTSKGKGFQGRMKRWGHGGRPASHGSSLDHRSGGSTGGFQNRSKTKPGVHGAGHMGCEKVTMKNLEVVGIYVSGNDKCILVHGSVPGPKKGLVYVRRAKKYERIGC